MVLGPNGSSGMLGNGPSGSRGMLDEGVVGLLLGLRGKVTYPGLDWGGWVAVLVGAGKLNDCEWSSEGWDTRVEAVPMLALLPGRDGIQLSNSICSKWSGLRISIGDW